MITITLFIHFFYALNERDFDLETVGQSVRLPIEIYTGIVLMLFPLMEWIADVILTRYKALKLAIAFLLITAFAAVTYNSIELYLIKLPLKAIVYSRSVVAEVHSGSIASLER